MACKRAVASVVECLLANQDFVGSSPITRSESYQPSHWLVFFSLINIISVLQPLPNQTLHVVYSPVYSHLRIPFYVKIRLGGLGSMSKCIMHIEDNDENRNLVRRLLQFEGYDVMEAGNATEALRLLKEQSPDLILMDINMPDMDGYTLTNTIKSMDHLNRIPIIAITANVMRGDRERTLQAGCDGYIEKPIDVDHFLDQVASFVGR
jgi:two-component system, cell cycle response regulator DivK